MLKRVLRKCNLVFTKQNKYKILFQLILNVLYRIKLSTYKRIKNINKPIVHYHAICWNEELMLPFMFDYYKSFIDTFYIYDNFSDDDTESIVRSHPNAHIIKYSSNGQLNDDEYLKIKNNVWKKSRGKADYVIVCDIDEFIYSENIQQIIELGLKQKKTYFVPNGFEMYSHTFPLYDKKKLITQIVTEGFHSDKYSKPILFDPHLIVEINYLHGAHQAFPHGVVRKYVDEDLKLLHYKNLGLDHILKRIKQYRNRISETNKVKGYGVEYLFEENKIINEFKNNIKLSNKVI